jgi:hypothetical protein
MVTLRYMIFFAVFDGYGLSRTDRTPLSWTHVLGLT